MHDPFCYSCESGSGMQSVVRSLVALCLALGAVVAVSTSWAMATAIPLLAAHTTALIMGGTFHPLVGPRDKPDFVTNYLDTAVTGHLNPAFAGPVTNAVAVFTPEQFFPIGRLTLDKSVAEGRANLHRCLRGGADCEFNDDAAVLAEAGSVTPQPEDSFMVFGYSQSSVIASLAKQDLIDDYQSGDPVLPFMLVANPMRPNGGVLMRGEGWPTIPILGISFSGASPTDSALLEDGTYVYPTVDIATQYDGIGGDFPVRPLNLIALVNSLLGYALLHGDAVNVPLDEARYQGREGDTSYYLVETDIVPLLQPLAFFVPKPILKAIDAPLRVIIEDAYDREISPGTATSFSWWPVHDVVGMVVNLIKSVPVAIDNLVEGFGGTRVLGTEAPGTFGVGGPDLPADPDADEAGVVASQQTVPTSERQRSTEYVEPEADPVAEATANDIEPAAVEEQQGEEQAPTVPGHGLDEPDGPGESEGGTDELDTEPVTPPDEQPGDDAPPADAGETADPTAGRPTTTARPTTRRPTPRPLERREHSRQPKRGITRA